MIDSPIQPIAVTKLLLPEVITQLDSALAGGPALLPLPGDARDRDLLSKAMTLTGGGVPDGTALLVPTSGSTGQPKLVALTATNLIASARATLQHLGGPGPWWLQLPLTHIAGWQILVRALVGGFPDVATDWRDGVRYASFVPTQLRRMLEDAESLQQLQRLDAILLGGAASDPRLLETAAQQRVRVIRTYGMSETAGGCVYDGNPLSGVSLRLEDDGRIQLGGPMVAAGYAGDPELTAASFRDDSTGVRWFRSNDVGRRGADGRLEVLGRLDDVIISGGENVHPVQVEQLLARAPGVREVMVVGLPDPEWGQRVVAVLVPARDTPPPPLDQVRQVIAERIGKAAAPRELILLDSLPLTSAGKPDRAKGAELAQQSLREKESH